MARTYEFLIRAAEAGERLDRYLTRRLPAQVSRAMIQRGIREGRVSIRGSQVKANHRLRPGETVVARFFDSAPMPADTALTPQPIPIDVVYEDAALLVVNKPPGLVTHPAPGHWDGTLVNAILWHLTQGQGAARPGSEGRAGGDTGQGEAGPPPHAPCPAPPLPRAGIVHRLDKDTSGLLVVAKTATAHAALSRQLKVRTMHRRYLALVEGHVPLDAGTIDVPVGRHVTHRKLMTVRHLGGRSATTHYRVLKRYHGGLRAGSQSPRAQSDLPYTLLEVSLETGRTHQVRVHLAHLGHPVLGDTTYGNLPESLWRPLGITRQLLHAHQVSFQHPVCRKPLGICAPIPADMARWIGEGIVPNGAGG